MSMQQKGASCSRRCNFDEPEQTAGDAQNESQSSSSLRHEAATTQVQSVISMNMSEAVQEQEDLVQCSHQSLPQVPIVVHQRHPPPPLVLPPNPYDFAVAAPAEVMMNQQGLLGQSSLQLQQQQFQQQQQEEMEQSIQFLAGQQQLLLHQLHSPYFLSATQQSLLSVSLPILSHPLMPVSEPLGNSGWWILPPVIAANTPFIYPNQNNYQHLNNNIGGADYNRRAPDQPHEQQRSSPSTLRHPQPLRQQSYSSNGATATYTSGAVPSPLESTRSERSTARRSPFMECASSNNSTLFVPDSIQRSVRASRNRQSAGETQESASNQSHSSSLRSQISNETPVATAASVAKEEAEKEKRPSVLSPASAVENEAQKAKKSAIDSKVRRPKRPLTAFNVFFKHERERIARERLSFEELGQRMSQSWRDASAATRSKFQSLANQDKERYKKEKTAYYQHQRKLLEEYRALDRKTAFKSERKKDGPSSQKIDDETSNKSQGHSDAA